MMADNSKGKQVAVGDDLGSGGGDGDDMAALVQATKPELPQLPRSLLMATCAAGTERAVIHELMTKLENARVWGPFLPYPLEPQQRADMVACRRLRKPHDLDFSVQQTILEPEVALKRFAFMGGSVPGTKSASRVDECKRVAHALANHTIEEGVILFSTDTAPHLVIQRLQCIKGVYAFLGTRDIPTAPTDRALRTFIGALTASAGDFAFKAATQVWLDVYGPHSMARTDGDGDGGDEQRHDGKLGKDENRGSVGTDAKSQETIPPPATQPQVQKRQQQHHEAAQPVAKKPKVVSNMRATETTVDVMRATLQCPPVPGPIDLSAVDGIDDCAPLFRASVEKRTSKSFTVQSPLLAGSLGAGVQLRFHWPVNLTHFNMEVYALLTDIPRAAFCGIALTDPRIINNRHRLEFGWASMQTFIASSLVRIADPNPGQVVYDNMCGTGTIPIEGAHEYPACVFYGSDVDEESISIAQRNIGALTDRSAAARAHVFTADATHTPLAASSVDVVISDMPWGRRCGSARANRKLYPDVLKEWARVLRPGGVAWALTLERKLVLQTLAKPPFKTTWTQEEGTIIDIAHKVTLFKLRKAAESHVEETAAAVH